MISIYPSDRLRTAPLLRKSRTCGSIDAALLVTLAIAVLGSVCIGSPTTMMMPTDVNVSPAYAIRAKLVATTHGGIPFS